MMIAGTECRRQGCSLQDGKQWGASGYAVTFPIAFNVVYNVLSIPQTTASTSNAYWGRFYITALTKNGFNVSDTGAGSNRWIAIGSAQPQWGYYVESQNPTDYRYWSIPFTSHYITMATKTYYEPKEEAVPWLVGIDMQKFICGYGANFIGSSYVSCVGIGCQLQWGINSAGNNGSEGESGWYAFPVNFNSACFALFCGLRNTDTNNPTKYDSEVQPRNWTTSKFNVYKQDYGGDPWFGSFIWFAIGRQPASYKL